MHTKLHNLHIFYTSFFHYTIIMSTEIHSQSLLIPIYTQLTTHTSTKLDKK